MVVEQGENVGNTVETGALVNAVLIVEAPQVLALVPPSQALLLEAGAQQAGAPGAPGPGESVVAAAQEGQQVKEEEPEQDESVDDDGHPGTSGSKDDKEDMVEDDAAGSFDCNICLELAQDPVVTFCGHLFCWPCLYKWMQLRSVCKECPVCKAPVQEERVIPLYGRGNVETSSVPRNGGVSDMEIPSRPPGQRPDNQTIAWHTRRFYDPYGVGFVAGAAGPAASARFGNVTFSAGFGLFPSLFRLQFHGFPDSPPGLGAVLPYGSLTSGHHHLRPLPPPLRSDQQETLLSRLLLFVGGVMILCFLYL